MDEIDKYFTRLEPLVRKPVFTGTSARCRIVPSTSQPKRPIKLTGDVKETLEEDIECMREMMKKNMMVNNVVTDASDGAIDDVHVRYNLKKSHSSRKLPIYESKQQILEALEKNSALVITGNTGCGKTTQVPQMIIEDAFSKKKHCNIVVTQPRRIAARSIAERVCKERGLELGALVGYQVGLDNRFMSEDTRILFCTTGVLLEKLVRQKSLSGLTHLILDEVHERDKDMDFLFIIIRMLMASQPTNIKIILMSATINPEMFSEYFKFYENGRWVHAPIIHIEKGNSFKVMNFFLEKFPGLKIESNVLEADWRTPQISEALYRMAVKIICRLNDIEADEMEKTSILIFLPGIYEITRMKEFLEKQHFLKPRLKWKILILHSMINSEEQRLIFAKNENVQKIILSTNIAESSITVPDVKYVIDFCLTKYLKTHSTRNYTSLELDWASTNSCQQRSGRAGRVMDGKCYRMIPQKVFNVYMSETSKPEMLLSPLENLVLKAKQFEMGPAHVVLGLAMDPPKLTDVMTTVLILKELGALLPIVDAKGSTIDGNLTFMGIIMAALPIDVHASRMIALGYCFDALEECIVIAAALTVKSIFKMTFDPNHYLNAYSIRLAWSNGSGSDLMAAYNAYRAWSAKYTNNNNNQSQREEIDFCTIHGLDRQSLHECHNLIGELRKRLYRLGIRELQSTDRLHWSHEQKLIILKVIICGAFYPNFFSTAPLTPSDERDVFAVLGCRDPNKTVYFSGFSQYHTRELYVKPIKDLFVNSVVEEKDLNNVHISFDSSSEKVFITFEKRNDRDNIDAGWNPKRFTVPGQVQPEVYKAIKMKRLRRQFNLDVMSPENEQILIEEHGICINNAAELDSPQNICVPKTLQSSLKGTVTHIENCSKFWLQPENEKINVRSYIEQLNDPNSEMIEPFNQDDEIIKNRNIVARDKKDGNRLHRARIIDYKLNARSRKRVFLVNFIDFGHSQECSVEDLFVFTKNDEAYKMPPRCFQCCLAEIKPSTVNQTCGYSWDTTAKEEFEEFAKGSTVDVKIYSVVHGVASVFLIKHSLNFNDVLIEKKMGEYSEENYISKENHLKRTAEQKQYKNDANDNTIGAMDVSELYPIVEAEPIEWPRNAYPCTTIQLTGPKTPLETVLYSFLSYERTSKAVNVDHSSVNSVLLSSIQQESNTKYMSAAHVAQSSTEDRNITISGTTLMPNIRGFGPLMAMIFCPKMDLKRDQSKSRYLSVLTGLGCWGEDNDPLFPEHDLLFPLDFHLDHEDIAKINQIRYSISTLLFTYEGHQINETLNDSSRIKVMTMLKESITSLLMRDRKPIEVHNVKHQWKEYDPDDFIKPNEVSAEKHIFPIHGTLKILKMDGATKKRLMDNCKSLYRIYAGLAKPVQCELCAIEIDNVAMLRIHLVSQLHKVREAEIGFSGIR